MKRYPPIPNVDDAPAELFDAGHLWIQEWVDGELLRFQLQESGLLRFGDREHEYDEDAVPAPYQYAARHVRERLDRDALRAAVPAVEDVVFFGQSTHRKSVTYDWDRLPGFLGFDVWSAEKGRFLPPDVVEGIFRQLGLEPVNAVRKEVRAVDFQPTVDAVPQSAWYDGPAAGIIVRNKVGLRAVLENPVVAATGDVEPITSPADEVVRDWLTERRLERLAVALEDRDLAVTVENLSDRALEALLRERHHQLCHPASDVDRQAVRSALAARASTFVTDRYRT